MESCDVTLSQPVEFIDTICLDKGVILTDSCGNATLTTENGESLPVTFIVSQEILDNSNGSVKEIIASNDDNDIIQEAPSESLDSEAANDDTKTIYTVHFPAEPKIESTDDCLDIAENGAVSEDKSVISENSVDNEFHDQSSDIDELNSATNLEDFMDVVTTYKCKFCRFSCHWKSGLVSHIRCCHIAEKKCIPPVKSDKEPNIVTARKDEEDPPKASSEEDKEASAHKIENIFSLNSPKLSPEIDASEHIKFSKSQESESDSEQSSKGSPILERHIFLCGQCSDGFMTLDECKQHMVDAHNIKLDKNMIKPLRKRGRPRTRPYTPAGASSTKESKRASRPPKNLDEDYEFGLKKKRREPIGDKVFR